MPDFTSLMQAPYFKEGVFIFAVLCLLGGFKFGVEGILK